MKLTPTVLKTKDNDLDSVFFEVTLMVSKNNELIVIDNVAQDYRDFVDSDILAIKENVRIPLPGEATVCPHCEGTGTDGHDRCNPPSWYICDNCNGSGRTQPPTNLNNKNKQEK